MTMKYYTRNQVIEAGIPAVSLDRWSKMFRDTDFVVKPEGKRLMYSEDFLRFAQSRTGQTGPSNLPSKEFIVALFAAIREGLDIDEIAKRLNEPSVVISASLESFGLEVTHA